jgi:hypothetical protein
MKLASVRIVNYKSFIDTEDVELGPINILVGRNNAGKSAFIHAVHLLQEGAGYNPRDIRYGAGEAEITLGLSEVTSNIVARVGAAEVGAVVPAVIKCLRNNPPTNLSYSLPNSGSNIPFIMAREPDNFIYTYLSKRKVTVFDQEVNKPKMEAVSGNLQNIVSKIDRLANPDFPKSGEYSTLCEQVLGFRVSTHGSAIGHQAGILVSTYDYIPIEAMGEGVSSLLGLITDLCMADGNLFLIEEVENDIHPEGLKTILNAIIEKSSTNQFIVSTHSNIVTKYLGSAPDAKIFNVELDYRPATVPTSTITEVDPSPQERMRVLRQLGYELYDFDLWEGWLILEESSAELIIRDYLIRWFAPKLSRVRTVSAGGTGKLGPTFEDFRRLFVFTHLETQYKDRAWVVADGDDSGKRVVERLQQKFKTWPSDHFRTWNESDFESYYPARFSTEVAKVLALPHDAKPEPKAELLRNVVQWCDENEAEARAAFEQSAPEVISLLQEIERILFDAGTSTMSAGVQNTHA